GVQTCALPICTRHLHHHRPRHALGMLEGVTRAVVMEVARAESVMLREEPHGPEALAAADEVFVSSTIREVMPVTSLVFLESSGERTRQGGGGEPGPGAKRVGAGVPRDV